MKMENIRELFQKCEEHFGPSRLTKCRDMEWVLVTDLEKFKEDLSFLKDRCQFNLLLDICGVDNLHKKKENPSGKRFEINYHILNLEEHVRIRVKVYLDDSESLPSITPLWKGAEWFEREVWDMYGILFNGRPKERILTHHEFRGHPLRKDFDIKKRTPLSSPLALAPQDTRKLRGLPEDGHWLNIDPSHPITKGALRVMVNLEGEKIKDVLLEIGYLHRGFEKLCEGLNYNQIIPYTDRLNYCSAALNNIGWCKAVEELMEIEISERAKALRMVFGELARVIDHLISLGTMAEDLGAPTGLWFFMELRERISKLFTSYCGGSVNPSLTRVGGMSHDLPLGWVNDCLNTVKSVEHSMDDLSKMFSQLPWWMDKTRVCPIEARDAIEWGFTGPCLRACGINYDLRKVSPYYYYGDVEFEVPLGSKGDVYDKYLVRMEEIRQSLKIITQVLDYLPVGRLNIVDGVSLPDKSEVYKDKKALDKYRTLIRDGVKVKPGEIYSAIEGANGELGFYIQSDGGNTPYRVKVRPPCFPLFQSFSEIVKGNYLSDAYATLVSLNIVPGELDR